MKSYSFSDPFLLLYRIVKYLPRKFKMAAQMLMLHESLEFSIDEESVMNSEDDGEMNILSAVATFMRRNLIRNQGYYECSLPAYSIDEFKKNFKRRDSQYGPLQDNRRVHHITSKSSCHSHSCYFDPLFPLF